MTVRCTRLLRIELTVADLRRAARFYAEALGFTAQAETDAAAVLPGAGRARQVLLQRGGQTLALQAFEPAGAPYPAGATACDQVFQHFALPVADMAAAMARLAPFAPAAISRAGPQRLPAALRRRDRLQVPRPGRAPAGADPVPGRPP